MTHIIPSRSNSRRGHVARRVAKSLILLPAAACAMSLSSCEDDSLVPGLEITADTQPIGEGLKVIGFALVGASVVIVIGRMLK